MNALLNEFFCAKYATNSAAVSKKPETTTRLIYSGVCVDLNSLQR